jgi:hypothetical protein
MNHISNGWYYHWLVEIPAGHQLIYTKIISFWTSDILQPLALGFLVGVFYLLRKYFDNKKKFILYLTFSIGLILCAWSSRIHLGGYDNVLMPAFWGIAILFGLGLNEFLNIFSKNDTKQNNYIKLFVFMAVIAQFFVLFYNPLSQMPKEQDWAYGNKLINELKQTEGEVYIPDHQYIARYAGKKSYSHIYVLYDFFESKSDLKDSLKNEFENVLKNKFFSAIISDNFNGFIQFTEYYQLDTTLFPNNNFLKCKTGGHQTRPEFIFKPK